MSEPCEILTARDELEQCFRVWCKQHGRLGVIPFDYIDECSMKYEKMVLDHMEDVKRLNQLNQEFPVHLL